MKHAHHAAQGSKIHLRQFGDEPKDYHYTQADAWLETLLAHELAEVRKPGAKAQFSATIAPQGKNFQLTGALDLELRPLCDRCGKEFDRSLKTEFGLLLMTPSSRDGLVSKHNRHARTEDKDDEEGSDWGTSDGVAYEDEGSVLLQQEEVDLSEIFKEQALLALPMTLVCRNDCPGLCPICGVDLAVSRCNCKQEKGDHRWDALKGVKVK